MNNDKTQVRGASEEWSLQSLIDGSVVKLSDGFTVGRSQECDLVLVEGLASRKHASFSIQGVRLLVVDAQSANGTFVNGEKIKTKILKPGDKISFDKNDFEVLLDAVANTDGDATMVREPSPHSPAAKADLGQASDSEQALKDDDVGQVWLDPLEDDQPQVPLFDKTQFSHTVAKANQSERRDESSKQSAVWQAEDAPEDGAEVVATYAGANEPTRPWADSREVILTGLAEPVMGRTYTLSKKKTTIGRSPLNDIILRSPSVSSQHAHIEWDCEDWVLYDNNSSNGTYLNGERIADAALEAGDIVAFGMVALEFDAQGRLLADSAALDAGSSSKGLRSRFVRCLIIVAIVLSIALAIAVFYQKKGKVVSALTIPPMFEDSGIVRGANRPAMAFLAAADIKAYFIGFS